ncbi:hypothetical protein [Leptospira wolffii]|uniref:hypothetical protein n=1 Tax=Leptospira wolffii TaxID=409998 RepID=UPI001438370F|nr:hypothetical protein [Leptospira wolffii]
MSKLAPSQTSEHLGRYTPSLKLIEKMNRILLIIFLFSNCITSKVFELTEGKRRPIPIEQIDSISYDKLNQKYSTPTYEIEINGTSSAGESLENCYSYNSFFKCETNTQLIKAEIKEVSPQGGLQISYVNSIFLHKSLAKIYKEMHLTINHDKPEIYATKDGKAFLSKAHSREFFLCFDEANAPHLENCNSPKRQAYDVKLNRYELAKGNLLIVLDTQGYVKRMYEFNFPAIDNKFVQGRVVIVSYINERKGKPAYYWLTPFSIIADIITSPIQFIIYLNEIMNALGALRALG